MVGRSSVKRIFAVHNITEHVHKIVYFVLLSHHIDCRVLNNTNCILNIKSDTLQLVTLYGNIQRRFGYIRENLRMSLKLSPLISHV
jgi:hypothetical protein